MVRGGNSRDWMKPTLVGEVNVNDVVGTVPTGDGVPPSVGSEMVPATPYVVVSDRPPY